MNRILGKRVSAVKTRTRHANVRVCLSESDVRSRHTYLRARAGEKFNGRVSEHVLRRGQTCAKLCLTGRDSTIPNVTYATPDSGKALQILMIMRV